MDMPCGGSREDCIRTLTRYKSPERFAANLQIAVSKNTLRAGEIELRRLIEQRFLLIANTATLTGGSG